MRQCLRSDERKILFVAMRVTGPTFRHEGGSVSVASEVKALT